jgi:hypothetical protein
LAQITGKILSTKSENPIYQISIYKSQDSSFLQGKTFYQPEFILKTNDLSEKKYLLIQSFGYLSQKITLATQEKTDLGIITLQEDPQTLETVNIVGKKQMLETHNGNPKINVEGTILETYPNILETLKTMPGVLVQDKSIEVLGRGAPLILIDGREAKQAEFENLTPSQIESIELIKDPSAIYSSAADAVLKITTKNQKNEGWNAKTSFQYSKMFRTPSSAYQGIFDGSYKKNKGSYYLNFQVNPDEENNKDKYEVKNPENNGQYNSFSRIKINTPHAYGLNFNTEQNIDAKNKIYYQGLNSFHQRNTLQSSESNKEFMQDKQHFFSRNALENNTVLLSDYLLYTHSIDTSGQTFKLLNTYSFFFEQESQKIDEKNQIDGTEKLENWKYQSFIHTISIEPQYILPLKKYQLELVHGVKYNFLNSQTVFNQNEQNNRENIFAVYSQLDKKWDKINFKFGLRYEFSNLQILENTEIKIRHQNYHLFLPNTSLKYQFLPHWSSQISYAYRIRRPSVFNLSKYTQYNDAFSSYENNPKLQLEHRHITAYNFLYKEKVGLDFVYTYSQNAIYYLFSAPNFEGILMQPYNFQNSHRVNISFLLPYQNDIWTTSNTFGYVFNSFNDKPEKVLLSSHQFLLSSYHSFKVKDWFDLDGSVYFSTPFTTRGIVKIPYLAIFSLGISKKFLQERLQIYARFGTRVNKNGYFEIEYYNKDVSIYKNEFRDFMEYGLIGLNFKLNGKKQENFSPIIPEEAQRLGR